jgi:hypothetical protein
VLDEAIIRYYPELYHENVESVFPLWDYFYSHTLEEFKAEWASG